MLLLCFNEFIMVSWDPYCRAETIRPDHDTIRYAIWCTRYDMFRDTFVILSWEADACDPGLRSEAPHSTHYNCLRSNDAQWLQQWRPPQSFQMQLVFVMNLLVLLEYTGCYLRYLMFVSNFGKCYNCTVSYLIFLRAYRDMYRSLCISGIPMCDVSFQPYHIGKVTSLALQQLYQGS